MNDIFRKNIDTLTDLIGTLGEVTGIKTDNFIDFAKDAAIEHITKFYNDMGIVFDINEVEISEEAVEFSKARFAWLIRLAGVARSVGLTPDDLGL